MENLSNQITFQVYRNQELPFQFEQGLLLFKVSLSRPLSSSITRRRDSSGNATGFNLAMWLKNNHMADQIPADWADCEFVADGRWNNRFFDREGVPMVRFTSVDYMPHATMTEMSFRIWEDFFCKFARAADGTVSFRQ